MRRTRLTAAGAAAVLALGGTIAGASDSDTDTQTLTITVEDQELSITTTGAATISVVAGAAGSTATVDGDAEIAYTVPSTDGAATISAAITDIATTDGVAPPTTDADWPFGDLEIDIALPAAGGSSLDDERDTLARADTNDIRTATGAILTDIPESANETDQAVTYSLEGTAPSSPTDTAVTITFTIAQ